MKHLLGLAVITFAATASASVVQKNLCAPRAAGVPTREGPPKWVAWTGTNTIPADTSLDDPRWVGATGNSFARGSAKAPLQTRILFGTDGASGAVTKYAYLSFLVDLSAYDTTASHPSSVTPRDVWLAFHRPTGHGGSEAGYLFQLHLTGSGTGLALAPTYCDAAASCSESGGTGRDYWRLFVDRNGTDQSACTGANGRLYVPLAAAASPPPVGWMTGGGQDAVRYWKLPPTTGSETTALNRWAVQIRIPMTAKVTTATSPITTGIEEGSTFSYEVTAKLVAGDGEPGGEFAKVGRFPDTVTQALCPNLADDTVVHEQLGDAGSGCPGCDPNYFAALTDLGAGGTHPACPAGLDLDANHIGAVFNAALPADHEAITISRTFGARDTTTPNHVVALPINNSTDAITAPIMARFRLAGWGSQPWSDENDLGTWKDIRGSGTGVCATPPSGSELCGATAVPPGKHALITFDWTIGNDPTLGASEYCQFGLTPPNAAEACDAASCSCPECGAAGGTRAHKAAGGFWPCMPKVYKNDQCMLVELSSPNGTALFERQSVYSNMRFASLSTTSREALIDARKLPVAPGQKYQDIYLIAMPRNMPRSVPPTTTSVALAQEAALAQATVIATPYLEDLKRIPAPDLAKIAAQLGQPVAMAVNVRENDKRLIDIRRARAIMPPEDRARIDALVTVAVRNPDSNNPSDALVHDAVSRLGSSTAADILPTLEIYPFYQPGAKGPAYEPMTSFSLFLSHESTLSGMTYAIDGAERVSENVFHLRIPVGFARRIQVRAQALVGSEPPLAAGKPKWPCGTCCSQRCGLVASLGNTVPGMLAGIFVVGGRRRRRRR